MGELLLGFLIAPMVLLVACAGVGLWVRRLCGGWLPPALVLPMGFAGAIVLTTAMTTPALTAPLAPFALAVVAVSGVALELRSGLPRPTRSALWPIGAGLGAFAAVAAPVIFSGGVGFTGYASIVDLAHHLDLTAHLIDDGRVRPLAPQSSGDQVVLNLLSSGYPAGWHALLGTTARLAGTDIIWLLQPLLAFTAAMVAVAGYGLLRSLMAPRLVAAGGGFIAAQANVLYGYGLVGGFKEMVAAGMLVLFVAVLTLPSSRANAWSRLLAAALVACAGFVSFSLAIGPWIGLIVVVLGAPALLRVRKSIGREAFRPTPLKAAAAAVVLLLAIPVALQTKRLIPIALAAEGGSAESRTLVGDLGNLAEPMPTRAAAGVWISGDYRFGSRGDSPGTNAIAAIVAAMALAGVAGGVRTRRWAVPALGVAGAGAVIYFSQRTGPWIELKAIAVTGPLVLLCATSSLAFLVRSKRFTGTAPRRVSIVVASVLALAVGGGVLFGNAQAYHEASVSPSDRLKELRQIGERHAGEGPTLVASFEEYSEYLLRDMQPTSVVNPPSGREPVFAPEIPLPVFQPPYSRDTDDFAESFLQRYEMLVVRRSPDLSRPPSNWDLADRTEHYEVWRRARPAADVLAHFPFWQLPRKSGKVGCDEVARRVDELAGRGGRLVYAPSRRVEQVALGQGAAKFPYYWSPNGRLALNVGNGSGTARTSVAVDRPGTYQAWIAGGSGRPLRISVGGQRLADLRLTLNYAGQWEPLGNVKLDRGSHRVEIKRPGGSLAPGDAWNNGQGIGPLTLIPIEEQAPRSVRSAPADRARQLCAERGKIDWLEVVRRDSRSARSAR